MIVVSDTGPLQYLILIERVELLPALFGQVWIPQAVASTELQDASTPEPVRKFLLTSPVWLKVSAPLPAPGAVMAAIANLGRGEREAIALALELKADMLLSDDALARKRAMELGVSVMGTLGIIQEASLRNLCDFDESLQRLTGRTNFRHNRPLLDRVRAEYMERVKLRKGNQDSHR